MNLNRRQFVRTVGSIAATTTIAGCSAPTNASREDQGVAETVIYDVPDETDSDDGGMKGHVTETQSDQIAITDVQFQHAGDKGLLVAGDVENTGDQALEDFYVEVTLYDENDVEDELLDSTEEQEHHADLKSGETWQWTASFSDTPLPEVDYYAVTARGVYD